MLPSSHLAPINVSLDECQRDAQVAAFAVPSPRNGKRYRKALQGESQIQARSAALLASEFTEFIRAAAKLETSYRALQVEVAELGSELSDRNAALQASLAQNEHMRLELQQIVDSMPCGVLVVDHDGGLSIINPESRRLLGLDTELFGERSRPTLQQLSDCSGINLERLCGKGSGSEAEQEFCIHTATEKRWLGVRNRGLFDQPGSKGIADRTILILRDITAHKRAEQERETARKAMALAEIATVLAHEIRNPLASLELFAGLLESDDDRRGEWISNLRAGIRSLSGTVNNVLSFHGSGSLKLLPLCLPALIGNAIQFAQPLADQASISLEFSADQGATTVMGNHNALQQVVLNLLSNAIRHTPAGGRISVSIRTEEKDVNQLSGAAQVVAEFSDTGEGIRTDQIVHIFEPGFSGSGDTSGLGLAVCKRIMLQHGGKISASNCAPSGARFTLHFPVMKTEPIQDEQ
jgi:signal transduction histidine kinase